MGYLSDEDRFGLMSLVVHFVNRDAGGLARDFGSLGFVSADDDRAEAYLKDALQKALAEEVGSTREIFGSRREKMSFAGVLAFLRAALPASSAGDITFALPPRFSTVVRALGALEGAVLAGVPSLGSFALV